MTARSPAAAAPKAVDTAALPVEAVVIVSIPLRRPSSITSAVARSLLDVVGLRVSSLSHRRGVPSVWRSAGAGRSGVPPMGSGYRTSPSDRGSRSRYRHMVEVASRSWGTSAGP
jgi:hypothetical protein